MTIDEPSVHGRPILSIVIPCHNSAQTLSRCIQSVISAAIADLEIVVVDDGSDDDVSKVLGSEFGDSNVRFHRQPNSGTSVARNTGASLASGDFIMFVDADDVVVPDTLREFWAFAATTEADIAVSDFLICREGIRQYKANINSRRSEFDSTDRQVLQSLCIASIGFGGERDVGLLGGPWAKIYYRNFLDKTFSDGRFFTPGVRRGQDVLFNVEAFGAVQRVAYFKEATYIYSVSTTSTSHRDVHDFRDRAHEILECLDSLAMLRNWPHLYAPISKLRVLLLEEAVRRAPRNRGVRDVQSLAADASFARGVKEARLTDFALGGKLKLILLRAHCYRLYRTVLVRTG